MAIKSVSIRIEEEMLHKLGYSVMLQTMRVVPSTVIFLCLYVTVLNALKLNTALLTVI